MTPLLFEMQMGWGETLKTAVVGFLIVLVILAVIAGLILLISKIFEAVEKAVSKGKKTGEAQTAAPASAAAAPSGRPLSDTESQGELKLENVDEPTAAVIMAIVSNMSGIPLNRLAFKSIKLIEEKKP